MHQRARLGILSILSECGRADFPYLKSVLRLTDGNLSRHLERLADDGLIAITKGYQVVAPVPRLDWRPCGAGLEAFLCTTAAVPTDYATSRTGRRHGWR